METQKVKDLDIINTLSSIDSIPILTDDIDNVVQRINFENFSLSLLNAKGAPAITNYSNDINYSEGQWVLANGAIYNSLVNDNIGNPITDEDYWEEVKLGGGYHPPILSCMWSDHLINDIQWLRADTFSWQSGDVYVTAYNTIEEEYSTGVEETEDGITFRRSANGFKIADSSQEQAILNKYNTDGIAWYYLRDGVNKRFKLPRTKYNKWTNRFAVVGNGMTLGLTDSTNNYGLSGRAVSNVGNAISAYQDNYGSVVGSSIGSKNVSQKTLGITTDGTKSGIEAINVADEDMKLYFYVGEYAKPAIEQTAGLNTELFNNKLDLNASNLNAEGKEFISSLSVPSTRYNILTLGASGSEYIAPANGWFSFQGAWKNQNSYFQLFCKDNEIRVQTPNLTIPSGYWCFIMPVKKGYTVSTWYGIQPSNVKFRFYYAEGSSKGEV